VAIHCLGSARVSRAGERAPAGANLSVGLKSQVDRTKEPVSARTPKVRAGLASTRETHALPKRAPTRIRHSGFVIPSSFVIGGSSLFDAASMNMSTTTNKNAMRLTQTPLQR
jgi:hypothetical protein